MIWIIDTPRIDWAGLAKYLPMRYIRKKHGCLNPLEPPPGCPINIWFQALAFIFCQAFGLFTASLMYLYKILILTYQRTSLKGYFPTFVDVKFTLYVHKPKSQDEAGYRARILVKVESLILACPEFDYQKGMPLSFFIQHQVSIIWEAPDDEDIRSFLLLWQLYYIYHYRICNKPKPHETIYFLSDENLNPFRARGIEAGLNLATKLITQLRALNVVLIIITQLPRLLDDAVKANLNTVVSYQNHAEQVPATTRIQNTSLDIAELIPSLPTGQGILTVGGNRIKGPVLLDTPLYHHNVAGVSSDGLDRISAESVKDLLPLVKKPPAREPAPMIAEPKRDSDRLKPDAERFLVEYESRPMIIKLLCEILGWKPARVSRAVSEIIKAGIWNEGPVLGKNNKTYVLTAKGLDYCKIHGIRISLEKSGTPGIDRCHQIGNTSVQVFLQKEFPDIHIKTRGTAFHISPDKTIEPDGLICVTGSKSKRVALQFAYKNSPQREGETLIRLAILGAMGPDYVLCVAGSKGHKQAIERYRDRVVDNIKVKYETSDAHNRTRYEQYLDRIATKIKLMTIDEVIAFKKDLSWIADTHT